MVKILIVEDDPLISRLYESAFQLYGYSVSVAFNGEEGFKKLSEETEKPTVVLLDVMMPKMNGLELLTKMKADANLKKIPVIMLTNLAGEKDAEKALALGAVSYLVKSQYEPKEVVDKVKEIIAGYTRDTEVPEVKTTVKKPRE